jgi:probable HAF family extracellular repeat protein
MTRGATKRRLAFAGFCLAATKAFAAPALVPFTIKGASSVVINALDDDGRVAGSFVRDLNTFGFVAHGNVVRSLPPLVVGGVALTAVPLALGPEHGVAGEATVPNGASYVFLLHNGAYKYVGANVCPALTKATASVFVEGSQVSYLSCPSGPGIPYVRKASGTIAALPNPGISETLQGYTAKGQFAGTTIIFSPQVSYTRAVLGRASGAEVLAPPGALLSYAGGINASGTVAGWFTKSSGPSATGFVYAKGVYTTFAGPEGDVTDVQGIDNDGRVVGQYQDSAGKHAYVYVQGVLTRLGTFGSGDTIQVVISPTNAHIAVTDFQATGAGMSFLMR